MLTEKIKNVTIGSSTYGKENETVTIGSNASGKIKNVTIGSNAYGKETKT